ncbi:hydantoinase/oxoprolinase family protein [Lentisalinibacter sediminis]|uniref:hydantoinase/oxoprolinase family protein n=1 Tax=Lentisalinibacter sediminis TaxID=2992237 RepID=UPI00386FD9E4
MSKYRVSADIGGTFTDLVVDPADGPTFVGKVATTPDDPARGVIEGVRQIIPDASDISFFVHGTTVGLNAFLERRGERVLLLMTTGSGDSYSIARGNRRTLYDLQYAKPKQLVSRGDVHEIGGRLSWDGEEIEPLSRDDLTRVVEKVRAEDIQSIAVCFLHAYAHPRHELEADQFLREALPDVSITLSHTVAREWREYERASTAVMNAYVAPVVQRYLSSLEREFEGLGMDATVHIMQSSGGVATAEAARDNPVFTLLSGPVGGTVGGVSLASATGRDNLLCVDMGGTSFDLSLVIDGGATATTETELEGLPLLLSILDIQTIGTGGGSIAWMEGEGLRVGPHSAGSVPGPACYGRGGTEPTVTDANVYLGRLGTASLLGGDMTLDLDAASQAIESLAKRAGMEPTALAEGILAISNAAMADAMRTITVSQGLDPRDFSLVAFGGAGPMAAVSLAEELEIGEVIVPNFPGTFSAWGMLQTDLRSDQTCAYYQAVASVDLDDLARRYEELEELGAAALRNQGVEDADLFYERSADMRYIGQEYSIKVSFPSDSTLDDIVAAFHESHDRRYGHSSPKAPVEFVNLRLAAFGALDRSSAERPAAADGSKSARLGEREAIYDGERLSTPIFDRTRLNQDDVLSGPVIVEEKSATTVVPPGWQARVDEVGNILISPEAAK